MLRRPGHTEAAVDLARLAGLTPAGVVAEIVNEDGTMARLPQLRAFADEHGLALITIAQLIEHRRRAERMVVRVAETRIPNAYGEWRALGYLNSVDGPSTWPWSWATSAPAGAPDRRTCWSGCTPSA